MTRFLPINIVRLITAAALVVMPAGGAWAATITAGVTANAVKPLVFSSKQNLDFGTILVPSIAVPLNVTVGATGTRTCPAPLVCSGVSRQAIFNVQGSNGQVVLISSQASDLTNASDGTKLRLTPEAPATVTLTNSGSPGRDFNVGGSIVIPTAVTDGLYTGYVEVTVDF